MEILPADGRAEREPREHRDGGRANDEQDAERPGGVRERERLAQPGRHQRTERKEACKDPHPPHGLTVAVSVNPALP